MIRNLYIILVLTLQKLKASDSGASMLEYALLAFLIGVVLIGALEAIGISITDIFGSLSGTMEDQNPDGAV